MLPSKSYGGLLNILASMVLLTLFPMIVTHVRLKYYWKLYMTHLLALIRLDVGRISLAECAAGALLALHGLCEQQDYSQHFNAVELRELIAYGGLKCIREKSEDANAELGEIHYFNKLYQRIGFNIVETQEYIPGWSLFNQGNIYETLANCYFLFTLFVKLFKGRSYYCQKFYDLFYLKF